MEALITNGVIFIAREITSDAYVEIPQIARSVIKDIGYTDARYGFHWETSGVSTAIHSQSSDIARGVDSYREGRGEKYVNENLENLGAVRPGADVRICLQRNKRTYASSDNAWPISYARDYLRQEEKI